MQGGGRRESSNLVAKTTVDNYNMKDENNHRLPISIFLWFPFLVFIRFTRTPRPDGEQWLDNSIELDRLAEERGGGKIVGKEYGRSYCAVGQQGRERRLLRAILSIDDAHHPPGKSEWLGKERKSRR